MVEEAGLETDGMAETTSQLQAKLKALTDGKVDIMVDANNFKNTTQILREMSAEWEHMTDVERAAALELLGGKRQANTLSAIISNFDIVEDAIEASENSAGSALEENTKVLDSIQGRVNLFNNAVEVMWNNLLDDEWIKLLVDGGTELVKLIDKLGSFRTILFSILTYYSVFKKDKLDLAELFGFQDGTENGYQNTFGQKGLTGWIANTAQTAKDWFGKRKQSKTGVVEEILGDPDTEAKDFAEAIRSNIENYATINTSKLDEKIDGIQNKLMIARQQLDDAKATDWNYYKSMGSKAPAQDRDNRIAQHQQEVDSLEKQLDDLEVRKNQILDGVATATVTDIDKTQQQMQSYQSFLGVLSEVQNKILEMPDDIGSVKILDGFNNASREGQESLLSYVSTLNDAPEAVQAYLASLKGEEATLPGLINYVNQHNTSVKASGMTAKAAAIGHAALNAAISMGISILISWVVSAVTKAINANKDLAESVEEAMAAYKNATKALKDHRETLDDIKEDYADLADGVDNLGRNISLSTDEYQRYNEMTNKIADMFPEMVSGYTEEGNAIIALKGNVEALEEAYRAEAQAARDAIILDADNIVKNFQNKTIKADFWKQVWSGLGQSTTDQLKAAQVLQKAINQGITSDTEGYADQIAQIGRAEYGQKFDYPYIYDALETAGVDANQILKNPKQYATQLNSIINVLTAQLEASVNPVQSLVNAYLADNQDYQKLSDEGQNIAQAIISGFDTEFYTRDGFDKWTDIASWIEINVVQKLQNADLLDKFNLAFNIQTQFNNGQVPIDEYISEMTMFIEMLSGLGVDEEIIKTVVGIFKIEDYETKKNSAMELLDSEGDAKVGTLTKQDLDIIDKNKTAWKEEFGLDDNTLMSWEDLTNAIQKAKAGMWEASVAFDEVSEKIDSIQDAYSALTDAVTQYNTNGYLTLDSLQALLSLEPEYLALLQMENGQLSINQSAMEAMIQTKLAEAKATAVQSAITQLNALATRTEADAITDSTIAANNAISGLGSYANSLGIVAQNAIGAAGAVGAFNAAVEGAQGNELVDQSEIDAIMTNLNNQINLIDSVGSNLGSNFKSIVGSGTGGSGESALDKLTKQYERQITNLENQQTEMENEMEILEAKAQGVSYSYYEALVDREQKKLDVYRQEWEALQGLELTDEVAEEIWAVEHAIQESTLAIINYRKEIVGLFTDAFDELSSVYDNEINITDNKKAYLEGYAELLELNDELPTVGLYEEMIKRTEENLQANFDKFTEQDAIAKSLREQVNPFKKGTEEYEAWEHERNKALVEMQAQAAETKLAYQENQKEIAQLKQDIEDLYITAWDKVREAFNNKGSLFENQLSYIDEYINALETMNINIPDTAYQSQIDVQKLLHGNTAKDLAQARSELEDLRIKLGEDDEQYIEKLLEVTELEIKERQDYNKILELEQQIIDNQLERFNQVIDRINHATSTLQNISDLIADEDVSTEDGVWTDEGMTRLGLAVQQMEMNRQTAAEYAQEIKDLEQLYRDGKISEKKYTEELQNLENGQWDAIKAYEDAKDAIVDIHEARVDMIEEGINKEIEAYQELIDMKKEELNAERDLYDFKKNVQKQTKDISQLERRIAALSGSDNTSDVAERRKLEAELYESQESLSDTYYDHAKDQQQQALDDEMEAFEESKTSYVEKLRESLEDTKALVQQTYTSVLNNGQTVLQTLDTLAAEYGVTITPRLTAPWQNAKGDADRFKNAVTEHINAIKLLVDSTTSPLIAKLTDPYIKAKNESILFGTTAIGAINSVLAHAQTQQQAIKDTLSKPWLDAKLAVDQYESYATRANASLLTDAQQKAAAIAAEFNAAYDTSSYVGNGNTGGGNPTNGNGVPTTTDTNNVKALQDSLNTIFNTNLDVDGKLGSKTTAAIKTAQRLSGTTVDGKYGPMTMVAIQEYAEKKIDSYRQQGGSSMIGQGIAALRKAATKLPISLYAKGTTGATKDQWAIDSEPWLGDELVLVPTAQGNLSYMRRGTGVVPADLTANLMEWGQFTPDSMSLGGSVNINMINNAVNKPEFNLNVDNFLRCDNVSQDSLPELKRFVNEQMNTLMRQLNYGLKKIGAH